MRAIPKKMRDEMDADSFYHQCVRSKEGGCSGRITWEHTFIYAGKQINEKWAIVPLCWFHHLGNGLVKWIGQWVAVNRMTEEDERKYPRVDWGQLRKKLNKKHYEREGHPERVS